MRKYQSKPHGEEPYETMTRYYLEVSRSEKAKAVTDRRELRRCDNEMHHALDLGTDNTQVMKLEKSDMLCGFVNILIQYLIS